MRLTDVLRHPRSVFRAPAAPPTHEAARYCPHQFACRECEARVALLVNLWAAKVRALERELAEEKHWHKEHTIEWGKKVVDLTQDRDEAHAAIREIGEAIKAWDDRPPAWLAFWRDKHSVVLRRTRGEG